MANELKPCPFCGYALSLDEGVCPVSDAVDDNTGEWKFTGICCPSCAVFLPAKTDDADTAEGVAAWNTRPAAPVEGLETVEHCTACGGTGRMGPYFPGGLSAICANCTNLDSQVNELRKEVFNLAKKIWHAEGNWQLWSSEDREIYAIRAVNSIIKSRLETDNAAIASERDALIEAGLKCCNGKPNPELPKFELALSFINSTNEARKAADMVCKDLKADNAALTARVREAETVAGVSISKKFYDHLDALAGYFIARPPTPDHEFVRVCNGDLRKLNEFLDNTNSDELVTRSQAEAIIAAKDESVKDAKLSRDDWKKLAKDLQTSNAALTARVKEMEDERYKLAYAITGGEDAPGYLDSLTVETLVEVARDNTRHWFAETDRAEALETQLAAAKQEQGAFNDLCKLTFVIQYNPNCPDKFLIRLPGKRGYIDLKPYGDQWGSRKHETQDVIGFGKTLQEAFHKVIAARDNVEE